MASSGNFPVFNVLYRGQRGTSSNFYGIITEGSTRIHSRNNNDAMQISTFENLKTGKWYWEWCLRDNQGDQLMHSGAADSRRDQWDYSASSATYGAEKSIHFHTYNQIVEKNGTDTGVYSSSGSSHSTGDVFGIALDTDNGKFYVHKNGTYYASGNPATGANPGATWTVASEYTDGFTPYFTASGGTNADGTLNFGQDSTFGGAKSAGGNADENGFGDFAYTPPSGFLAVCSANLPISSDIDPAQTDNDYVGEKHFDAILYTGNSSTNNITGLGFKPDLVWIKIRSTASNSVMIDSSRGTNKMLHSTVNNAEATTANLTSFNSDGFSLDGTSDYLANYNQSTKNYVAWCWRANGGTTATNGSGTITTTVQANQAAGFSIVLYTGTGSNATIGHGLSAKPDLVFFKRRSGAAQHWKVYSSSLGAEKVLTLNDDRAQEDVANMFQDTEPTSSVFSIGTESNVNTSTASHLAYFWHSVAGFSKFGIYTGNGDADGPFLFTGFRPRLLYIKKVDAVNNWRVRNTASSTSNTITKILWWDLDFAETSNSAYSFDVHSHGFKIRTGNSDFNGSTNTYIYGAWGDTPLKYGNTF